MVFGHYSFLPSSKKQWSLDTILFCLRLKNNRKLPSLLLPLNLNLNYENLFVFGAKVLLLFGIAKFFS